MIPLLNENSQATIVLDKFVISHNQTSIVLFFFFLKMFFSGKYLTHVDETYSFQELLIFF